ncbi:hypothetical protein FHR24_002412 [Wenyingzhuangia heitensis]|uniref:PA14 domain-containing protein n=1 Tax=Wenyingzhuangia heitensis TaxID=1487859 RepID=A0ABX0UES7_9FLAO|nr:family 16 glycoside hydrolase [Wenyingzhuangia heitensis]NIJ45941.1 hypothetical protein [Wenyingzhuangia heitensis]
MKNKILSYLVLSCFLFFGNLVAQKKQISIPYSTISLDDLSDFKKTGKNWQVASSVSIDRTKKKTIFAKKGKGILVNTNDQKKNKHLVTTFEHGDIELELDVMMPVGSNSGIYFQGRYEIQLYDSWGVKTPKYSDIGSVYQRWDKNKEKGKQGYEGTAASVNAAKAPGLWQHLKIIFHAPTFNDKGEKIKNAWFEEVSLNGVLIVENAEVTGPTRGASFQKDEKAMGPIVLQGDHGPVAFKNIKYKLYNKDSKIAINNIKATIYESNKKISGIKAINNLKKIKDKKVNAISPLKDVQKNAKNLIAYTGTFTIPETANYVFEMRVFGGALLAIGDDTVMNINQNNAEIPNYALRKLKKGEVPFTVIYNQVGRWGNSGFELFVEGEGMQRHSIQKRKISEREEAKTYMRFLIIDPQENNAVTQRSFMMHKGVKRSHAISVGFPQKINYAYDLETGSLLHVWNLGFLNATHMWHSRGKEQLGYPDGPTISFHGDEDFALLKNEKDAWPKEDYNTKKQLAKGYQHDTKLIQKGYKVDTNNNPTFLSELNGANISNKFVPSSDERKLKRQITTDSKSEIWHKLTDASQIEIGSDGVYIIDNNYYIDFSGNGNITPIIRSIKGTNELLVKIPAGKQAINYTIIW